MSKWKLEAPTIKVKLLSGMTMQAIADDYGVTREFIRQIKNKYIKELSERDEYGKGKLKKERILEKTKHLLERYGRVSWKYGADIEERVATMITAKKNNAFRKGIPFNIGPMDVDFPKYCPILGMELDYFSEGRPVPENTPSFDRIDPTEGYIKGNVAIISWRANRIKNNGTAKEHRMIAEWMESIALVESPSSSLPQESDPQS